MMEVLGERVVSPSYPCHKTPWLLVILNGELMVFMAIPDFRKHNYVPQITQYFYIYILLVTNKLVSSQKIISFPLMNLAVSPQII